MQGVPGVPREGASAAGGAPAASFSPLGELSHLTITQDLCGLVLGQCVHLGDLSAIGAGSRAGGELAVTNEVHLLGSSRPNNVSCPA